MGLFTLPHLARADRVLVLRVMMTCLDMATVLLLVNLAGLLRRSPALVAVCLTPFASAGPESAWHAVQAAGERWREPWRLPAYAAVAALGLRELWRGAGTYLGQVGARAT